MLAACGIAALSAVAGFWLAYYLNAATSAAMTVTNAALFFAALAAYRVHRRAYLR